VLLITYSGDRDIAGVADMLSAAGVPNLLWFYDARDEDVSVEASPACFRIRNRDRPLAMEDLAGARLVVHRTGLGHWDRPVVATQGSPQERGFAEREWASLFHGLFMEAERLHPHLRWINAPSVSAVASEKYQLLATAHLDGLRVPDYRVSTEGLLPISASGQFVCKAVGEIESIDETSTYCTAVLDAETVAALPFRTDCPSLIQERILAEHELRVYHLLGETLGLRIRADQPDYADLRLIDRDRLSVDEARIAPDLGRAVRRYCRHRRLDYCVFDFLRTRDGRDLLIDVTPGGTWSHFESPVERSVTRWYADTLGRFLARHRHP
jgi:hypothetical protein